MISEMAPQGMVVLLDMLLEISCSGAIYKSYEGSQTVANIGSNKERDYDTLKGGCVPAPAEIEDLR